MPEYLRRGAAYEKNSRAVPFLALCIFPDIGVFGGFPDKGESRFLVPEILLKGVF